MFCCNLQGIEVAIDASQQPHAPEALAFPIGGKSPSGHIFSANSRYLTLDGKPWFPVMGEFHFSRYPDNEWEREILKMKAGGITVLSTYVFWIHHEETEGKFDWSGRRDLGKFIQLCGKHGLYVWLRIGPWAHGEVRNGGFPDWLVKSGVTLRQNDPAYLGHVTRFYGAIAKQVQGQFWKDGGPIVGVQIENEYHPGKGGIEHMEALRKLAIELGMDAPFFTATGWGNAALPSTGFLPVFGGYTDQFWSNSRKELEPNQNFFFTAIRDEDNLMGDLSPKNPGYNSKYEGFPFLTAEMGGGMAIAYHRRPVMRADDSTAAALVKLGAGITGLGYYMYHGGTNPDGLTSLQENQLVWNGYNDMEQKSYDFQAPIGEFGQINPTYRTLKTLHLFLNDFGSLLAPMITHFPAQMPKNRDDVITPRLTARTEGQRGFIFINNYERNYPLGDKTDFQVSLHLPGETLAIPQQPTVIPDGAYPIWPVNLNVGGVNLRYATAQLLCRIADPETLVFFAWPGLNPEFSFSTAPDDAVEAPQAKIMKRDGATYVDTIQPGTSVAIRVSHAQAKPTQIVVLSRDQALHLSKANLEGQEHLLLSPADVFFSSSRITVSSRSPADLKLGFFPKIKGIMMHFHEADSTGIFQQYVSTAKFPKGVSSIKLTPVKPAGPVPAPRISAKPRAVAMEPDEKSYDDAAEWNLQVAIPSARASIRRFLQINYTGDVARIFAGNRFDNDNFYKGPPWELGLWRYSENELKAGLNLRILPLRRDAPIFLEQKYRPNPASGPDLAELKSATIVEEYQDEINLADY